MCAEVTWSEGGACGQAETWDSGTTDPREYEKVPVRPKVTMMRRGREHYNCIVVNLKGERIHFLKYEVILLPLLCYVEFDLGQSLLWPLDEYPLNLYNNHQHIPLTPFPSILGICFFSVSWWEFFFYFHVVPAWVYWASSRLRYVLAWRNCLQRPSSPAFGELLLLLTSSVSQNAFHENTSLSTCWTMKESMVKSWEHMSLFFLEIHKVR